MYSFISNNSYNFHKRTNPWNLLFAGDSKHRLCFKMPCNHTVASGWADSICCTPNGQNAQSSRCDFVSLYPTHQPNSFPVSRQIYLAAIIASVQSSWVPVERIGWTGRRVAGKIRSPTMLSYPLKIPGSSSNMPRIFFVLWSQTISIIRVCFMKYAHDGPLNAPINFGIPVFVFLIKTIRFGTSARLNMLFNIRLGFYPNHDKYFGRVSSFAHRQLLYTLSYPQLLSDPFQTCQGHLLSLDLAVVRIWRFVLLEYVRKGPFICRASRHSAWGGENMSSL